MRNIDKNSLKWKQLKEFAKENRKNQTFAEKIIWNLVRNNKLGFKFKRQYLFFDFILDFVCIELKLVVEIDGESHIGKEEYDEYRQHILENLGFKVLRFSNEEVTGNGNIVESKLKNEIKKIQLQKK
jgi:very-short-patch-repair endonuclease